MCYIYRKILGIPFGQKKVKGDVSAPPKWTRAVVDQTKDLPKVRGACLLRVTFLLPEDKFPTDLPYGPDLDNLTKRLLDALSQTIFSQAPGKDSCVIALHVMKTRVDSVDQAGATFEVLPVSVI